MKVSIFLVCASALCRVEFVGAGKRRQKGEITEEQLQSPTPGSKNMRTYTVEHTPEAFEAPAQKKESSLGKQEEKN